jgi:hypothetical protein
LKASTVAFVTTILAASLAGCAPMRETGSEDIQFSVEPMTASCDAYQHDSVVGHANAGQQTIAVPRSEGATDVLCSAPGYKAKRITVIPDRPGTLGALASDIGYVTRTTYPDRIQIVMEPSDRRGQPR